MEKLHSLNAYSPGMPFSHIFKISSVSDYCVSMKKTAEGILSREQFLAHMDKAPKPIYFQEELKKLIEPSEKVLFLSVGDGYLEYALMKAFPSKEYYLADVMEDMIQTIRKFAVDVKKVETAVADNRNLPFQDSFFDCVIVLAAEYFFDQNDFHKMLSEIKRTLVDNGSLGLVSVSLQEEKQFSFKERILSLVNRSTVLSLVFWYLLKRKICVRTGYRRAISDFILAAKEVGGLQVRGIDFVGNGVNSVRRALFRISKSDAI